MPGGQHLAWSDIGRSPSSNRHARVSHVPRKRFAFAAAFVQYMWSYIIQHIQWHSLAVVFLAIFPWVVFCRARTEPNPGYFPGYYPCRKFCKFCTIFIPVPGASVSYVRPWYNTRGKGMPSKKNAGCGYGCGYNIPIPTRNFSEFCTASIPVPGTSVSEKVMFCRVRTEPYPGYYPYPEVL